MDAARMAAGQRFDRMTAGGYFARSDGRYAPKPGQPALPAARPRMQHVDRVSHVEALAQPTRRQGMRVQHEPGRFVSSP